MKILSIIDNYNDFSKTPISDGFIIRFDKLNYKSHNRLTIDKILSLTKKIEASKKEVFIDCTILSTDNDLETFNDILKMLSNVKGIIVSDIGFINLAIKMKLEHLLIYNPETLLTNHQDFNFFADYQLYGACLAKELNLEEVIEILSLKKYKSFMIGFGHLNMFYSRRKILKNYLKSEKLPIKSLNDFDFRLREELRPDFLPVLETNHGSSIFRSKPISIINILKQLKDLDYLILDNIFIDKNIYYQIVSIFCSVNSGTISALKANEQIENLIETDSGLLHHKSLIRKEREL